MGRGALAVEIVVGKFPLIILRVVLHAGHSPEIAWTTYPDPEARGMPVWNPYLIGLQIFFCKLLHLLGN
jgi:hypothetical protein